MEIRARLEMRHCFLGAVLNLKNRFASYKTRIDVAYPSAVVVTAAVGAVAPLALAGVSSREHAVIAVVLGTVVACRAPPWLQRVVHGLKTVQQGYS